MVRALLEGRKTQTRRLATSPLRRAQPGDRLWVREAFAEVGEGYLTVTRADYPACVPRHFENVPPADQIKWRPSIHMPRRCSRLSLTVERVWVEPLGQISREDAQAEGVDGRPFHWRDYLDPMHELSSPLSSYRSLWASLHGAESWHANPEVVAIAFSVER